MDDKVIKYYRKLQRTGFPHAGIIDDAAILLDAVQENMRICDHVGVDSLQVRLKVTNGIVEKIRYLCTCDPTTNVVVEIMCGLVEGRNLADLDLSIEAFTEALGSENEDFVKKANGLTELVHRGIERYHAERPEAVH